MEEAVTDTLIKNAANRIEALNMEIKDEEEVEEDVAQIQNIQVQHM